MKHSFLYLLIIALLTSCATEKTIFIANHYTQCNSIKSTGCLLIKEKPSDEWAVFEGQIEGFDYKAGHDYQLKVKVKQNTSGYSSDTQYKLVKIISQQVNNKYPDKPDNDILKQKKWVVQSLKDFNLKNSPELYFTLTDSRINGFSGCNNFGGPVKISDDGHIATKPLMVTKRACASPEINKLEAHFLSMINQFDTYKVTDDQLSIYDADNKLIVTCNPKALETQHSTTPTQIKYNDTKLSAKDNEEIKKMIQALDMDKVPELKVPETTHQQDASKAVNLTFKKLGKNVVSPTFDENNPPQALKGLVDKFMSLSIR